MGKISSDRIGYDEAHELLEHRDDGRFYWRKKMHGICAGDMACKVNSHNGYRYVTIRAKSYRANVLAFMMKYGRYPIDGMHIDHIDRNRCNNKIENLREVTPSENCMNKSIGATNKSGFKGVGFCVNRKKPSSWKAYISVNKKQINLGYFKTKEEAISARKSAEIKYYGKEIPQNSGILH